VEIVVSVNFLFDYDFLLEFALLES
jgi:hypothetical protein